MTPRFPWTRLLTALALLAAMLMLLWRGSVGGVLGVFAAVALRAGWEWAALCPGLGGVRRGGLLVALAALLAALYALPASWTAPALLAGLAWWAVALRLVRRYPALPHWLSRPLPQAGVIVLALATAWLALARLADAHRDLLLLCLALVWAADSAAFVVGRRYGRHKLSPQVSPGKTIEGLCGGLAGAALTGLIAGLLWRLDGPRLAALVALTTLCAAVSVVGDLTESLFKRRAGVKDSSHLLPGHGGVLDRIDALIAAAPLFALTVPPLVGG
jgi:phosphatidate cytidylyltransferase